jgi:hypothetical protein
MSSSDRFREYDARQSEAGEYFNWVDQKDKRAAEFHRTIGKRALKLVRQFGVASSERWTEYEEFKTFRTAVHSKEREFNPSRGIEAARLHIVRSIDTLSPLPFVGGARRAAGRLTRTGLGEIRETTIEYIDTTSDTVRSASLNKYIYREATPFLTESYSAIDVGSRDDVDNFIQLLDRIEGQIQDGSK